MAPLQPGSHSQRPVTWWQLELWTQSHLCSQPSPKNPLEQASDKTHRRSAYNIRVWEQYFLQCSLHAYFPMANYTNCFDRARFMIPGVSKASLLFCWLPFLLHKETNMFLWSLGSHLTDRALLSNPADTHIFLSLCHISLHSYSCRPGCSSLHNVLPHTLGERERKP